MYNLPVVRIFIQLWLKSISCCMSDQLSVFSFSCDWNRSVVIWSISWVVSKTKHSKTKTEARSTQISVVHIFIQLWLKSISCLYSHSVVTKIDQLSYDPSVVTKLDQLLYDRSVVRIFIQLWLKSISCYMIVGAPNENIDQNHLNIALLNVF